MIYYLRTLSGKDKPGETTYRIIVEYEESTVDDDSTITMLYADKKDGKCPNNYSEVGEKCRRCPDGYKESKEKPNTCARTITRNYYSNVQMVLKSKITD